MQPSPNASGSVTQKCIVQALAAVNAIGLPGHHLLSHGIGNQNGYEQWGRYDQFLAEQLAYFLQRLRSATDPFQEGSLLDHTIVLYGCSTSRTPQAVNDPLILAGAKALGFRHGQYRQFDESKHRLFDLYVMLLQQLGLDAGRFADSEGSLSELVS